MSSQAANIPDIEGLPPLYEPVRMARVDSVSAAAAEMARDGAGEGTLLIAECQERDITANGTHWMSPAGNLYAALILEPEYGHDECMQLGFAAMTSMGDALSRILTPMTSVGYKLPGQLLINGLRSGRLQLRAGWRGPAPNTPAERRYDWLVLAWTVNVAWHPPNPEPERYASVHASGAAAATPEILLEAYTRHFLSTINRWADEGFDPVRKRWEARAEGLGETLTVGPSDASPSGIFEGLGEDGSALIRTGDGRLESVDAATALAATVEI